MRREDCIVDCVGPDCEGCRNYKTRQMKDEIKDKIIEIYEKLLKIDDDIITVNSSLSYVDSFSTNAIKLENERDFLYEKFKDLKSELTSLKSQLSEAGEEKQIIKKCRQCRFFDLDEHCEPLKVK